MQVGFCFGQTNEKIEFEISESYIKDSVLIENIVEFYSYSDDNTPPTDAIRVKIRVTNLGSQPIPNLMRVSNRSKYLQLYYNNINSNDLNIVNGLEGNDWPWTLSKGGNDTFESGYVLVANSGIFTYGNVVSVRWNYLGFDSPIVVVDIIKRRIIEN